MSSQPAPSLAQAGSEHWGCPLYEEGEWVGRGKWGRGGWLYIQSLFLI